MFKGRNWKKVAQCFDNRKTEVQCLQHWRNVLNPSVVKGKGSWTAQEDEKLSALVKKHGHNKWSFIGKFLPGRIGKQCRERWHNHLNPSLRKVPWTPEEEKVVIEARARLGNRWAQIARMLPGRSDNDVKNRWYASLRKRVENTALNGTVESKASEIAGEAPGGAAASKNAGGAKSTSGGGKPPRKRARTASRKAGMAGRPENDAKDIITSSSRSTASAPGTPIKEAPVEDALAARWLTQLCNNEDDGDNSP
eukprot:g1717.t1